MHCTLVRVSTRTAACLLAASLATAAHADPSYAFTDLGTVPGYAFSTAVDVNNSGNVAGISFNIAGGVQTGRAGWLWSPNGTRQSLLPSDGYDFVQVRAVNDVGQVAGWRYNLNAAQQFVGNSAFTWSPATRMRFLQPASTTTAWRWASGAMAP